MTIRARLATVDITPGEPIPLAGYAGRTGLSRGVESPIEANIIVLETSEGPIHLLATDTLYGGELADRFARRVGADRERVMVLGSHTHFAPGIDGGLPRLGPTYDAYLDWVIERCARAIESAELLEGVAIRWADLAVPDLFSNRRRPTLGIGIPLPKVGRVITAPQSTGPVDDSARVLTLWTDGSLVGVLWSAACHPVASRHPDHLSPSFPGAVRDQLRLTFGQPNLPVLFLQGCSGDVRPNFATRRPPRSLRGLLRHAAAGFTSYTEPTTAALSEWNRRLSDIVVQATRRSARSPAVPLAPDLSEASRHLPGWERPVRLVRLGLGDDIALLAVNAEVVSARARDLARRAPRVIPTGCLDEVIGYWPTDVMRREGGYEGCRSQAFFPSLDWDAAGGADTLWQSLLDELLGASKSAQFSIPLTEG